MTPAQIELLGREHIAAHTVPDSEPAERGPSLTELARMPMV